MHPIVSVDLLGDPAGDRVLDKLVALPLQTDSFLCFRPTVRIHPTTGTRAGSASAGEGGPPRPGTDPPRRCRRPGRTRWKVAPQFKNTERPPASGPSPANRCPRPLPHDAPGRREAAAARVASASCQNNEPRDVTGPLVRAATCRPRQHKAKCSSFTPTQTLRGGGRVHRRCAGRGRQSGETEVCAFLL